MIHGQMKDSSSEIKRCIDSLMAMDATALAQATSSRFILLSSVHSTGSTSTDGAPLPVPGHAPTPSAGTTDTAGRDLASRAMADQEDERRRLLRHTKEEGAAYRSSFWTARPSPIDQFRSKLQLCSELKSTLLIIAILPPFINC